MSTADWYRKTAWGEAEKRDFFARLARARGENKKAQYLRIQAFHLQSDAKPPDVSAALELLDLVLRDYPGSSDAGSAHLQRAQCLEAIGRNADALAAYRAAVKADVGRGGVHTTEAPLEFAMFVLKHRRSDLHDEVLEALKGSEILCVLPQNRYKLAAFMAIAAEHGRGEEAARFAMQAGEIAAQVPAVAASVDPAIQNQLAKLARKGGLMSLLRRVGSKR